MNWFEERLKSLSGAPSYKRPPPYDGLRLDSNENLAIPPQIQGELAPRTPSDIRQYPVDGAERLIGGLAAYLKMPEDCISVGNGSDQILDLILSHMAGSSILASNPTFSFFADRCRLHNIRLAQVPCLEDMAPDMERITREAADADMLYLDSPNNPTGYQICEGDLRRLLQSCRNPVILDEAYADFAEYSAYTWIRDAPNLMVVRTMSKSFGLAGLRAGYMVARPEITKTFREKVQYPYPLSSVSVDYALGALRISSRIEATWAMIRKERRRIAQSLRRFGAFTVFESSANFVLFDAGGSYRRIHQALAEQGIMVRMLGPVGGATGCLRVSVGSRQINSRFLMAIRDLMK